MSTGMDGDGPNTVRWSPRGDLHAPLKADPLRYEEAEAGSIVDRRYVLRREIARGGVGVVFEAEHVVTRARVALKTLGRRALALREAHSRMELEARVLGATRHPMVVAIHDAGLCDTHGPYVSLELIEGRPLDGLLLSRQTLPVGQAIALVVQLCEALSAVHGAGYVHRDVKPANVLISRSPLGDQLELIDFGLAKPRNEPEEPGSKLTQAGELLGTVDYMSPEQLMSNVPIDGRTDVYSAGALLCECLTGEPPWSGSATSIIAQMIAGSRPRSIRERRADVPLALEAAVRRALELSVERRFATPRAFAEACIEAIGGALPTLDLLNLTGSGGRVVRVAQPPPAPLEPAAAQRRQFARAPYVAPVRVVSAPGEVHDGRTEDISEGGVLIVIDHECASDTTVEVRMPLPASGRVVAVRGIARWVKTGRANRAIGVEFVGIEEAVRTDIQRYVTLMSGAARAG